MIAGPSGCSLAISWVGFCSGCWVEEPPAAWPSAGALAQRIRTTAAENSRCHMPLTRVELLRLDVGLAHADGGELVAADPPGDHFLLPGLRVESPAVALFHQRYRERPRFVADDERLLVGVVVGPSPTLFEGDIEHLSILSRRCWVGGINQIFSPRSEDRQQAVGALRLGGVVEGLRRVFGRGEHSLSCFSRR